jgi:hypothetical protein
MDQVILVVLAVVVRLAVLDHNPAVRERQGKVMRVEQRHRVGIKVEVEEQLQLVVAEILEQTRQDQAEQDSHHQLLDHR